MVLIKVRMMILKLCATDEWDYFKSLWQKARGPEVRLVVNKEVNDAE